MESWSTCTSNCINENYPSQDQGLPPGFRFHPTDEELITHYLAKKIDNPNFSCHAVSDADLNKSEPWELPGNYLLHPSILCKLTHSLINYLLHIKLEFIVSNRLISCLTSHLLIKSRSFAENYDINWLISIIKLCLLAWAKLLIINPITWLITYVHADYYRFYSIDYHSLYLHLKLIQSA